MIPPIRSSRGAETGAGAGAGGFFAGAGAGAGGSLGGGVGLGGNCHEGCAGELALLGNAEEENAGAGNAGTGAGAGLLAGTGTETGFGSCGIGLAIGPTAFPNAMSFNVGCAGAGAQGSSPSIASKLVSSGNDVSEAEVVDTLPIGGKAELVVRAEREGNAEEVVRAKDVDGGVGEEAGAEAG